MLAHPPWSQAQRQRLTSGAQAQANFVFTRAERFILREMRCATEVVESAFQRPAMAAQLS